MHHFLKRTLLLLLILTGVSAVGRAQSAGPADGYYRIVSQRSGFTKPVRVHDGRLGYPSEQDAAAARQGVDLSQVWKVKRVNGTYWIVNVQAEKAVQATDRLNVAFTVGYNPAHYYIKPAPGDAASWIISTDENFSGKTLWHNGGSGLVQNWQGQTAQTNHWKFEALGTEELKAVAAFETRWPTLEKGMRALEGLRAGGIYRVRDKQLRYWQTDAATHEVKATASVSAGDASTLWVVESADDGFAFRSALTGRVIMPVAAGETARTDVRTHTMHLDFKGCAEGYFHVSADAAFADGKNLAVNGGNALMGGNAVQAGASNAAAEWTFLPVTDVSEAQVKALIRQNSGAIYAPEQGKCYVMRNLAYPERVLTHFYGIDNDVTAAERSEKEMGQLWRLEQTGDKWALRNVASGLYVGNNAGRSAQYPLQQQSAPFTVKEMDKWLPNLAFIGPNGGSLHSARGISYKIVNWDATAQASQWRLEEVTLDEAALAAYLAERSELNVLGTQREALNAKLQHYFEDYACTRLRAEFRTMGADALRTALQADDLPASLVDMVLRVRADHWIDARHTPADALDKLADATAKRFRIDTYGAYSHPQKWASSNELMPTSFGQYSQLTAPTGITIAPKSFVNVFVDQEAPASCDLRAELVQGKSTTGTLYPLRKGLNTIYAENEAHLYINYVINDVTLRYTDQPQIRIHVEGGRVNGYHDSQKHTNADWDNLRRLKAYGFLNDEVVRLKSKHTIHSISLKGVEQQQDADTWTYNGEYKGINGVLGKWDWTNELEQDFLSPEQFEGRFNCLLFNTDAAGLYATNYGTFLGTVSSTFSYKHWAKGAAGDNGGNVWAVVHETGHHYQKLFNLARCIESSNNLWSNIALWKRGSNVSRGESLQTLIDRYNRGDSWIDMGLGDRMRMYWQLWLYYVELGHKPDFYRRLMAAFRKNPINFSNAKTDFLLFARLASDAAQEDLTEFFTFYGFFRKTGVDLPLKFNDSFYDNYYAPGKITVAQEDIDACLRHMAQYSRKPQNILFIDDRIRKSPAAYEGAQPGDMRLSTDPGRNPGDANVFGDVGHYTDYGVVAHDGMAAQPPTVAQPEAVQIDGRSVRIRANGAVGYKVYDEAGNLVIVSNRNEFAIPAKYDLSKLTVAVGGGDGGTVEIIKNGAVLPQYDKPLPFDNTAGLTLSKSSREPGGKYIIRNYRVFDGKYYYADAQTHATDNRADAGEFILVGGQRPGEYHLFSLGARKWATYTDRRAGRSKVTWVEEYGDSKPWRIDHVLKGKVSYYNIFPAGQTVQAWNWNGGVKEEHTSVGFYTVGDQNSHWEFIPADLNTQYRALVQHADSVIARDAASVDHARKPFDALRATVAAAPSVTAATQADIDALKAQLQRWAAWHTADSLLQVKTHGDPSYTQFRTPFTALVTRADHDNVTVAQLKAYGDYYRKLLLVDSLVSMTNPGYPLPKIFKVPAVYNRFRPAAEATAPSDFLLESIESAINRWRKEANYKDKYPKDEDAYHMPEDGRVYRLRSYYDGRFVTAKAPSVGTTAKPQVLLSSADDNTSLWVVQRDAAGKKVLASASGAGYLSASGADYAATLRDTSSPFAFGTARLLAGEQRFGTLYLRTESLSLVAAKNNNAVTVVGDNFGVTDSYPVWQRSGNSGGTSFFFDEVKDAAHSVTLAAGNNGNYATVHLPYAVTLPAGLKAYRVKELSAEQSLVIEPLEGTVLPAGTPAILSAATAGTYALRPTVWSAPIATKLRGTLLPLQAAKRSAAQRYYALTVDRDTHEVIFRAVNSRVDIPGNRAYFALPVGAAAPHTLSMHVGQPLPTAVKGASTAEAAKSQPQAVYDLSGRRVDPARAKGVLIRRGRKVILR